MSKQEEVIRVIADFMAKRHGHPLGYYSEYFYDEAKELAKSLDSQRVVIRVDRELPRFGVTSNSTAKKAPEYSRGYCDCLEQMHKAGYSATIPIIEGE